MAYPSNDAPDSEESGSYRVAAGELRAFVERVERLSAEKKDLQDDISEVYAEAKGRGYDTQALRKLIAERKIETSVRDEQEAVLEVYREALGDV